MTLGLMYYFGQSDNGIIVPVDQSEGVRLLGMAAKQNNVDARWILGKHFYECERNWFKSTFYLRGIVSDVHLPLQERNEAAFMLGMMLHQSPENETFDLTCESGKGPRPPKSPHKAAEYFAIAAGIGSEEAKYQLALMYTSGDGVPQHFKRATELLESIAWTYDRKNVQFKLAEVYLKRGDGLHALAWSGLAATYGNKEAKMRDSLNLALPAEDVEKAQQLGSEWLQNSQP
ncbi:MAG: hypothetical protein U1E67_08965 [Hyphomicrobiales bacterium]